MFKFIKKLFSQKSDNLEFSYEEKHYTLGVKVLVLLLTIIVIILAERAMADLSNGIPRVSYPRYNEIEEEIALSKYQKEIMQPLRNELQQIQRRERQLRGEYDSSLLEKIADEPRALYGGTNVVGGSLQQTQKQITDVENKIFEASKKEVRLQTLSKQAWDKVNEEYKYKKKVRQLKVFMWEALFWVPFFFLGLFWYTRSKRKESKWTIISLAVLVAGAIITVKSLSIFIWSWIPLKALEWLWMILKATMVTRIIGYYLMIALVVLLFGALIMLIHKRITDPVRIGKKRVKTGECPQCCYPLKLSENFCGGCGKLLKEQCKTCKKIGYEWQNTCVYCGKK